MTTCTVNADIESVCLLSNILFNIASVQSVSGMSFAVFGIDREYVFYYQLEEIVSGVSVCEIRSHFSSPLCTFPDSIALQCLTWVLEATPTKWSYLFEPHTHLCLTTEHHKSEKPQNYITNWKRTHLHHRIRTYTTTCILRIYCASSMVISVGHVHPVPASQQVTQPHYKRPDSKPSVLKSICKFLLKIK